MRSLVILSALLLAPVLFAQQVTGSAAVTAQYQDPETIERITLRLAGEGRESWNTVIANGEPALTWGNVATFSILMHEVFDAQLTEAEAELMAKRFSASYRKSDAAGKKSLTTAWTEMLDGVTSGKISRSDARTNLDARLRAEAAAGTGWATVAREALDRRKGALQTAGNPRPQWANAKGFDASMSVADLDASIELLYFMWVAAGRAPELVTLDGVALLRAHFATNFATLPVDLQYALANAQKIYAGLRMLWYTGAGSQRTTMARNFNQELDALGLPDPNASARSSSSTGGQSRGDFAAEMVVGLAGSSYKSAW